MRLNEVVFNDAKPVEGYGPGFFRICGTVIEGPVITGAMGTPTELMTMAQFRSHLLQLAR